MTFPSDFIFGAATSAYQIEGATGRGRSIWDRFCDQPGNIADGSNGDVACDHVHRWQSDVELMAGMNLNGYRFSFAWPRLFPQGNQQSNAQGFDFYDQLIDTLLQKGITPYATLYHWDLPESLGDQGGWLNRDTPYRFAEFAEQVVNRFGDRVQHWATLNEPRCAAFVGHLEGRHAPGLKSIASALQAAHHMLLGHGLAIQSINRKDLDLGIVLDIKPYYPSTASADAQKAAQQGDGVFNRWFFDAVLKGQYPEDIWLGFAEDVPEVLESDMSIINAPISSLGVNYYTRSLVEWDGEAPFPNVKPVKNPQGRYTTMDCEIFPEGLEAMLVRLNQDYSLPNLYVAETGAALADQLENGQVHDPLRIQYLNGHLKAVANARKQGVPVTGYFNWSLMDNFEWGHGFTQRFGLVYVDYANQKRYVKSSGRWFAEFIAEQQLTTA